MLLQQFYDIFLFRQQDEPLSGNKNKHQTQFRCAWKPPTKKNSYFNPVKFSISRHGQFPKPSLLPLFVKVTGSLFQMTLIFQDNINIIPCKSKLKHLEPWTMSNVAGDIWRTHFIKFSVSSS